MRKRWVLLSLLAACAALAAPAGGEAAVFSDGSGITGSSVAAAQTDPCRARPRPPGCPATPDPGTAVCDDQDYVDNFHDGDRAACLANEGQAPADEGGGRSGSGSAPKLLSVPKSLRLRKLLKRGIRFGVALVQMDSTVTASLTVKGSKLGAVKKSGLAAGDRYLTLKLSRKGKAKLRRVLKRKPKVKAALKVTFSGGRTRSTKTIFVKR